MQGACTLCTVYFFLIRHGFRLSNPVFFFCVALLSTTHRDYSRLRLRAVFRARAREFRAENARAKGVKHSYMMHNIAFILANTPFTLRLHEMAQKIRPFDILRSFVASARAFL